MRTLLFSLGLVLASAAVHAVDVGVSISVSQPGVYGRIDIGRFPQPVLMAPQPVVIQRTPHRAQPVYLWVPPGHQKNWGKHCGRYNACAVPVYFVQEEWYQQHVMAPQQGGGHPGKGGKDHPHKGDKGDKGHGKGHGKGQGRD